MAKMARMKTYRRFSFPLLVIKPVMYKVQRLPEKIIREITMII